MLAALVLLAGSALLVVTRWLEDRTALERAAAASLLFPALVVGLVELLSVFGLIGAIPFLVGSGVLLLAALAIAGDDGRDVIEDDFLALRFALQEIVTRPTRLAAMLAGLASVSLAVFASYLLVPWSWDGLGYHLPFAFDALSEGRLRPIPSSISYVNAYPHLGDVFLVGYRLSLLDGTFIELAQLAFAPLLVLSIALWARRAGVPTSRAIALGMLVLAIPSLALQLSANYVDVMYAALATAAFVHASGELDGRSLALFAVAAGLALGTKPSAPPLFAVACALVLARAWRASRTGEAVLAIAAALAIGSWKYVENMALHGNPIWPVELHLGPVSMPGLTTMDALASSGLRPPMRDHGWLRRVFESWTTVFPDRYAYDMRVGGLGPLFTLVLLPTAIATGVAAIWSERFRVQARAIALPVALLSLVTLASPGAFAARYTFALPAALLAFAMVASQVLPQRMRAVGDLVAAALTAVGLVLALPGYSLDGPSLFTLASMDERAREHTFGLDEYEGHFADARALVRRGEAIAYDAGFGLPGRLYPLDGRARVLFLDHEPEDADALVRFVDEAHVRVIALTEPPSRATAELARARPDRFTLLFTYPDQDGAPCALFEVRPVAVAGSGAPP